MTNEGEVGSGLSSLQLTTESALNQSLPRKKLAIVTIHGHSMVCGLSGPGSRSKANIGPQLLWPEQNPVLEESQAKVQAQAQAGCVPRDGYHLYSSMNRGLGWGCEVSPSWLPQFPWMSTHFLEKLSQAAR